MATGTLLLYLIVGVVVAVSMPSARLPAPARFTLALGHLLFWPFFAPDLLGRGAPGADAEQSGPPVLRPRLYRARARLLHAIDTSTQLGRAILAPQLEAIDAVMASLEAASRRLAEMDA